MLEMVVKYSPGLILAGGAGGVPATATQTTTIAAGNFHAALTASNTAPSSPGAVTFYVSNPTTDGNCADVSNSSWNLVGDATNPVTGNGTYISASGYGPFGSSAVYYFW
jgi:hypothetical protein